MSQFIKHTFKVTLQHLGQFTHDPDQSSRDVSRYANAARAHATFSFPSKLLKFSVPLLPSARGQAATCTLKQKKQLAPTSEMNKAAAVTTRTRVTGEFINVKLSLQPEGEAFIYFTVTFSGVM